MGDSAGEKSVNGVGPSRTLFGVAALLWLAAAFLPATTVGSGSTLSSHRLADLIGSGVLSSSVPQWVGPAWYAMPVGAALLLMALGLNGTRGILLRLGAALLATASALVFGAYASKLDVSRIGTGLWCGIAGSACAIVAAAIEVAQLTRAAGSPRVL